MVFAPLRQGRILHSETHDELFDLLSQELQRRNPDGIDENLDVYLRRLRTVPVGLRAMAIVHPLGVSVKATEPLTQRFWKLQDIDNGLFGYWTRYARKYPQKVAFVSSVEQGSS